MTDPFILVLLDRLGAPVETPGLLNTWEPDTRGDFPAAVAEAVDPTPLAWIR